MVKIFLSRVVLVLWVFLLMPVSAFARTPDDPYLDEQWYLDAISAFDAWDEETGDDEVIVAVLDSGLDIDHPDLRDQIWENDAEVVGDKKDNDHNGFIDDVHGWDFISGDSNVRPDGSGGIDEGAITHGTLVAGIIGAMGNNDEGVAGVAWEVKILPVRMLDGSGYGDTTTAADAIAYAVDNGADVINMSFSGITYDTALEEAVHDAYDAGVLIVAATGNMDGGGIDMDELPIYPACFEDGEDWVVGVAALDENGDKADFSNYGRNCTDISAPGVSIFGAQTGSNVDRYGGYYDGTSVAAPQVTGAAALLLAAYPSLSVPHLMSSLQLSVDPVSTRGTYYEGKLGAGSLNVARALEVASQYADEEEEDGTDTTGEELTFVGAQAGSKPAVYGVNTIGAMVVYWEAYASNFLGGVNVAVGDIDGDGVDEVVTGAGVGGGPHVRVFEQDGTLIWQFFAFDASHGYGVVVSAEDVDGDGDDDILATEGNGGSLEVRTFAF